MEQLGIFIIWQSGEKYIDDILEDIKKKFKILHSKTLEWDVNDVCLNLNKLYPHREFHNKSPKVKEIGRDKNGVRLHTLIVFDNDAKMENSINLNFKTLKDKYRKKYRKNFIHSADHQDEAIDNITQVLEMNYLDIINRKGQFVVFDRDNKVLLLSELIEFNNIKDVFNRLDKCNIKYIVLRNWDELDGDIVTLEHGDVDIMVDDFYQTIVCLNAKRNTKLEYRVQYKVAIDNREIPFDIRHIGDNYYFSLLYHALVHKPFLSNDYNKKLRSIDDSEPTIQNLKEFLSINKYQIVTPNDKSVYFKYSLKHYKYLIQKQLLKYEIFQKLKDMIKGRK